MVYMYNIYIYVIYVHTCTYIYIYTYNYACVDMLWDIYLVWHPKNNEYYFISTEIKTPNLQIKMEVKNVSGSTNI